PIAGKELELTKPLITLGKPGTQVAVISRRPQGYFLTHIESDGDGKRYPTVNGEPIGAKAYQLKDSDMIELAGIKMEFSSAS
ncbi:MAG: FHA domain-containing protein, partial [Gammaproteobacteria bacterium]